MQQEILSNPKSAVKIPEDFFCPITSQIMTDPVMLVESGHTYERELIEQWLVNNNTDPFTNKILDNKMIAPNITLKKIINDFLKNHPEFISESYLPKFQIKNPIVPIHNAMSIEPLKQRPSNEEEQHRLNEEQKYQAARDANDRLSNLLLKYQICRSC